MTMKIEGSNQALTCEPQPQTPSTQVAAPVAMNRVEEARVAERAFADTQLLGSKGLAETLERVGQRLVSRRHREALIMPSRAGER